MLRVMISMDASKIPKSIPPSEPSHVRKTQFEKVDQCVEAFAKASGFEGVVGVRIGTSIHTKTVGFANRSGALHSTDTPFPICSLSKTFTAAAIMRLVEQNKLSLDTKVREVIEDPEGIFQDVTIEELLRHTSGIPHLDPGRIPFHGSPTFDEIYASLDKEQPRPPRGVENYNNFGYVVLAKILEKVGRSYPEALEETLFHPMGIHPHVPMRLEEMPQAIEGISHDPTLPPFMQDSPEVRIGAGNIYSSMEDLLTFENALSHDGFLTSSTRHTMYSRHMGWDHQDFEKPFADKGIEVRGKAGSMGDASRDRPTLSTVLYSIPERNICIAVFCNAELTGEAHSAITLGETLLHLLISD